MSDPRRPAPPEGSTGRRRSPALDDRTARGVRLTRKLLSAMAPIVHGGQPTDLILEVVCAALLASVIAAVGQENSDDARVLLRRIAKRAELLAEHDGPYPAEF